MNKTIIELQRCRAQGHVSWPEVKGLGLDTHEESSHMYSFPEKASERISNRKHCIARGDAKTTKTISVSLSHVLTFVNAPLVLLTARNTVMQLSFHTLDWQQSTFHLCLIKIHLHKDKDMNTLKHRCDLCHIKDT